MRAVVWSVLLWLQFLLPSMTFHPLPSTHRCLPSSMKKTCSFDRSRSWRRYVSSRLFGSSSSGVNQSGEGTTAVNENTDDNDIEEMLDMALGEEYYKELNRKVAEAKQEEWDVRQGVNPSRTKPLPLKANLDMWTYTARGHLLRGNFSASEELYQRCVAYDPCDGRAWLGLARLHWKKGQALLAEKSYKDGLYYNPNNPFLLQSWAVMLEKLGKIPQAMKLLTKSVRSNPRHAASWVALGRIHQRNGQVDEARYCYSSAVEGDSTSYVALQAWGVLEVEYGNVMAARDLFRRAVRVSNGRCVHALQAHATLEKKAGNLEEAERLLQQAIQTWPESTRIRLSFAELHELRGDVTKAREVFQKGQRQAESRGDAGFFQSWALFELRQCPSRHESTSPSSSSATSSSSISSSSTATEQIHAIARRLFKKAVTINKYHSASWVAWAKHEQRAGNYDVARRLLITGISNFPHSRNIGWLYAALASLAKQDGGDIGTARACYSRAVAATPPQKSLQLLLDYAKLEGYGGDKDNAKKLFEKVVSRFPLQERAWDDYIDYASYLTGEKSEGLGLGQGTSSADAPGPVMSDGLPSDAVATATATSTTGTMVKTLLDRKRLALGRSSPSPSAVVASEEELSDRDSNSDGNDDGGSGGGIRRNKQTAGTASFNMGERTSFTVEDSDALDPQSWADDSDERDESSLNGASAEGVGVLDGVIDDDEDDDGVEREREGRDGENDNNEIDFRFLDKFLRSRSLDDNGSGNGNQGKDRNGIKNKEMGGIVITPIKNDKESRAKMVDAALQSLGLAGSKEDFDLDLANLSIGKPVTPPNSSNK